MAAIANVGRLADPMKVEPPGLSSGVSTAAPTPPRVISWGASTVDLDSESPTSAQLPPSVAALRSFEAGLRTDDTSNADTFRTVAERCDLSTENARLAFENEMLRLQVAQAAAAYQQPYFGELQPCYARQYMYGMMPGLEHMYHDEAPSPRKRGGRPRAVSDVTRDSKGARPRLMSEPDATVCGAEECKPTGFCTTLMVRNLPNNYTRSMLLALLDDHGFAGLYDFLYLPIDFKSNASLGYAFVNFQEMEQAEHFRQVFEGFQGWAIPSQKVCTVQWSNPLQGLEAHVERFRNSPVMHETIPDDHKPLLFIDGRRAPFPAPTKKIRPPRVRPGRYCGGGEA